MKYSVFQINPFNSELDIQAVIDILNEFQDIDIEFKGSIPSRHDGEMSVEFFNECSNSRPDNFCIFLTSFPQENNWFILRNHLDMDTYEYIEKQKKWIAATVDLLEEISDLKDLDLTRVCAFNIYKAIRTSEWLARGLTYKDDIYTYGVEDSSFIFCETKMNFFSAFRSSKLGDRVRRNPSERKFSAEEVAVYEAEFKEIKGGRFSELIRTLKKREIIVGIFLSVVFGTLASVIASFIYEKIK